MKYHLNKKKKKKEYMLKGSLWRVNMVKLMSVVESTLLSL